ncbi:homocysteine S-methyltransferase family protein [Actinomycetospora lutea]|uniref:homocysteine S-methyltransferase family protein n=1 Tax=Actinomycetospora lutea TaxID=663604 RepID=UPI002365B129|nr:homocysteine S-methyltransferase family protein [Actinomycetospora lutea]MDD7941261.1 homocysteine S-methyltransferase family protein [Actinomycetospora lutea]
MTSPPPLPSYSGDRLAERLAAGPVVCGEGYLFELERRGYLQAGAFVPEVVLEHPEEVAALHRQFVHAGSDVVEAFTYYAHREKLRVIGKDGILEPLNRQALEIARGVADTTGTLLAGNICNTGVYEPADPATHAAVRGMFTEQVGWAAEAGADYVIGETFRYLGEARIALEVIREAGLPSVILLVAGHEPVTRDGVDIVEACRELAACGADVVGLNCVRGPATMLPLLGPIAGAVDVPVAALPVPYRTTAEQPTFHALRDPGPTPLPEDLPFPTALDPFTCHRYEIADFTRRARAAGVRYFGLCCGAAPHHLRAMAETLGRTPPASRYSPDMSKHVYLGADTRLRAANQAYRNSL